MHITIVHIIFMVVSTNNCGITNLWDTEKNKYFGYIVQFIQLQQNNIPTYSYLLN